MAQRRITGGFWRGAPTRQVASIVGAITFLGGIVTSALVIDERYAHAGPVEQKLDEMRQAQSASFNFYRKQQLEDRIFELNMKGTRKTEADHAMIRRYEGQLTDINRNLQEGSESRQRKTR